MTTTQEIRSDRTDGPIHGHFGLTYAQYQVLNRTLMQSMPVEWQERMVCCLDELHAAFEHVEQPESYIIKPAREATYSDLSEAEMVLLNVSRPDSADHEDIADVYYDDEGVERNPDDRVYIPTGADPIPHYRRGYVEPNIPAAVEGGAVTREPSDIWRASVVEVLCSQALADDLGDVRDAETRLWKLLGVDPPVCEHDEAWPNTKATLQAAGIPLPEYLADDEDEPEATP